jgi:hypothetical protein
MSPAEFGRCGFGYFTLLCRELDRLDFERLYPQAAIRSLLATIHSDPEKLAAPYEPIDFMPGWERTEERRIATAAELITLFGAVTKDGNSGKRRRRSNRA